MRTHYWWRKQTQESFHPIFLELQDFPGGTVVKNLRANAGDTRDAGSIPGQEDPLEEESAAHFSILVWRIPWTEEPGELWSRGSQKSQTRLRHKIKTQCWILVPQPGIEMAFPHGTTGPPGKALKY